MISFFVEYTYSEFLRTLPAATVGDHREALLHFGFLLSEPLGGQGKCMNDRAFTYQVAFVTPAIHLTVLTTHQSRTLVLNPQYRVTVSHRQTENR